MAGSSHDRRAGGERPRLTLKQRLSIKHIQMVWEAIVERIGRGYRRNKNKRKRRRKQTKKQLHDGVEPALELAKTGGNSRMNNDNDGCLVICGCFPDRSRRSRLTVRDSDAPPVYSNEEIIHDIVPPLQMPPRA